MPSNGVNETKFVLAVIACHDWLLAASSMHLARATSRCAPDKVICLSNRRTKRHGLIPSNCQQVSLLNAKCNMGQNRVIPIESLLVRISLDVVVVQGLPAFGAMDMVPLPGLEVDLDGRSDAGQASIRRVNACLRDARIWKFNSQFYLCTDSTFLGGCRKEAATRTSWPTSCER